MGEEGGEGTAVEGDEFPYFSFFFKLTKAANRHALTTQNRRYRMADRQQCVKWSLSTISTTLVASSDILTFNIKRSKTRRLKATDNLRFKSAYIPAKEICKLKIAPNRMNLKSQRIPPNVAR